MKAVTIVLWSKLTSLHLKVNPFTSQPQVNYLDANLVIDLNLGALFIRPFTIVDLEEAAFLLVFSPGPWSICVKRSLVVSDRRRPAELPLRHARCSRLRYAKCASQLMMIIRGYAYATHSTGGRLHDTGARLLAGNMQIHTPRRIIAHAHSGSQGICHTEP